MILTAKFIELTDSMEEIERYIKNGFRRIERFQKMSDRYKQDLALLRAAICVAKAANQKVVDIMEQRSLAYMSSVPGNDKPCDDSEFDSSFHDENSPQLTK